MRRFVALTAVMAALALPGVAAAHAGFEDLGDAEANLDTMADLAALDPFSLLNSPELALADEPSASGNMMLAEGDLDGERGGFMTPLGLDIGFGAVVRTTIDGALALESRLTWDTQSNSAPVQTTRGADPGSPAAGGIADIAGAAQAGGIKLDPTAQGWTGVVLPGATGGATAVLQQLGAGGINNLVVNTADNRRIVQTTDITLDIPELPALQSQATMSRIGASLQQALDLELAN